MFKTITPLQRLRTVTWAAVSTDALRESASALGTWELPVIRRLPDMICAAISKTHPALPEAVLKLRIPDLPNGAPNVGRAQGPSACRSNGDRQRRR